MNSFELLAGFILPLYGLASVSGIAGIVARKRLLRQGGALLAVCGFAAQTVSLLGGSHALLPQGLSWGAYLQLMAWFLVLCGLLGWWRMKTPTPAIFAAPLALIFFCMALPYQQQAIVLPPQLSAPFYALHIGSLFLCLGLMALAFGAGMLFVLLEKRLKRKSLVKGFLQDMPALSVLDRINAAAVATGFPLYTLGIVSGYLWAKPVFGTTVSGDPKEILSVIIWGLYAVLFHNRLICGWKGRKPALFIIAIFALSVFSVLFINVFLTTHHSIIRQ